MLTSGIEIFFDNHLWHCEVSIQSFGDSLIIRYRCYEFCFFILYLYHITWWNRTTSTWGRSDSNHMACDDWQPPPHGPPAIHARGRHLWPSDYPLFPQWYAIGHLGTYSVVQIQYADMTLITLSPVNKYGDNLWYNVYWLHTDMTNGPRRHRNFYPIYEGFLWEHVTIRFVLLIIHVILAEIPLPHPGYHFFLEGGMALELRN
jgi:hypothetical protein